MHNMPKKEFIIGKPSEPEEDQAKSEVENKEDTEEHSSH
jgi:hypothetical protein